MLSVDKAAITGMIDKAQKARKEKLEKSMNLMVDMRSEFVLALKTSLSFSSKLN
jgi:hypothetical protein